MFKTESETREEALTGRVSSTLASSGRPADARRPLAELPAPRAPEALIGSAMGARINREARRRLKARLKKFTIGSRVLSWKFKKTSDVLSASHCASFARGLA